MVDRNARDRAAQLLRDFVSGKLSNDAFADGAPATSDRAIAAIWDTAWVLYSDMKAHHLTGTHRLSPDTRRICVRWLLFLHSDRPYEWPDIYLPGIDPAARGEPRYWRRLFFGFSTYAVAPDAAQNFLAAGHYPVWPFLSAADYRQALRQPRLLSGRRVIPAAPR